MTLAFSFVVILAYLFSPYLGVVVTIGVAALVLLPSSRPPLERLLHLLVVTMPLYMTPIIGGLPPLFSWTTLILVGLSVLFAVNSQPTHPFLDYSMVLFAVMGLVTALFVTGLAGLYYFAQLLVLAFPVVFAFKARGWIVSSLHADSTRRLLRDFAAVIAAIAIGVLLQAGIYFSTGVTLGNVSFFLDRVSFDLTIPAFSVLSGILALGVVLGPVLWRDSAKVSAVILMALSAAAILVNSSRTGIAAAAVVLMLMVLFPPRGVARTASRLAIIPIGVFIWVLFELLQSSSRFEDGTGLFDDNGRLESIVYPLRIFVDHVHNILAGVGYVYEGEKPHNFIVETLVSSGIIVSVIVVIWIIALLVHVRGGPWVYILATLLVGSMFYAGFYAVKVFAVAAILAIIATAVERSTKAPNDAEPYYGKTFVSGPRKRELQR